MAGPPGPRSRRPYTITAAGRQAFAEWLAVDTVPGRDAPRSSVALRVAFAAQQSPEQWQRMVASAAKYHVEQLAMARERASAARGGGEEWIAAAVGLAVGYHRAVLAWLVTLPCRPTTSSDHCGGPG